MWPVSSDIAPKKICLTRKTYQCGCSQTLLKANIVEGSNFDESATAIQPYKKTIINVDAKANIEGSNVDDPATVAGFTGVWHVKQKGSSARQNKVNKMNTNRATQLSMIAHESLYVSMEQKLEDLPMSTRYIAHG